MPWPGTLPRIERLESRIAAVGSRATSATSPILITPSGNISFDATSLSDASLPLDQQSMGSSDFTHPFSGWQFIPAANINNPPMSPNDGADPDGGMSGTILNANNGGLGTGDIVQRILSPGTSMTMTFSAANLGLGATLTLRQWNAAVNANVDFAVTTTGTLQTYSHTFTGLTAGAYYYFGFAFSGGPSGAFNVSKVLFTPGGVDPNGPFSLLAKPFQRLTIWPEFLVGNHQPASVIQESLWWNNHDAGAETQLITNPTQVLCEVLSVGSNDPIGFRVNGKPWASSAGITAGGVGGNVQAVQQTLPSNTRSLDIVWSTNPSTGRPPPQLQNYARALYLPAGVQVSLRTRRYASTRRLVAYGDSLLPGAGVIPNGWSRGLFGQLKARFPGEASMIASGGRQLHDDCATSAAAQAFAQNILFDDPTDFFALIGINDFNTAIWHAAGAMPSYQAALTLLFGFLIAAKPNLRILIVQLQPNTLTTPNANGETITNFNTAITGAAAGLTQVTTLMVDLWPLARLVDSVHPDAEGNANGARLIANSLAI